jgi:hypothetical protein
MNTVLANAIWVFHLGVVLFVLLAPFSNILPLLLLHIVFSLSLLLHWVANNNVCSLSVLEAKLRGTTFQQSFTHKFIAPVYDMSQTSYSRLCYVVVIALMVTSAYKMYTHKRLKEMLEECKAIPAEFPFLTRLKMYGVCLKDLFTLRV